jgi:hypothetical protein
MTYDQLTRLWALAYQAVSLVSHRWETGYHIVTMTVRSICRPLSPVSQTTMPTLLSEIRFSSHRSDAEKILLRRILFFASEMEHSIKLGDN